MREKTLIIAEAGVNHNGELPLAYELIKKAKEVGADFIKFQTFKAKNLVCLKTPLSTYQKVNLKKEQESEDKFSQFDLLKNLELSYDLFVKLKKYALDVGVGFLSSPFDLESIDLLDELGLDIFKIPSGEITNRPYLEKIAKLNKELIISTGMSTMEEIQDMLDVLIASGQDEKKCSLLHCNTQYPTPYSDVNLRAMETMREKFKLEIGYSDHTSGISVPIAAVALGARIIEKHFTLDCDLPGPDHKASLCVEDFKFMVKGIREVELSLGDGLKRVSESEKENRRLVRKSLVALRNIKIGEVFDHKNLGVKRPGTGISPMIISSILGEKAKKEFMADEIIEI